MRKKGGALLFALAVVAGSGCRCSDPSSPLVQDFEGRAGLGKWPRDAPGGVERSTAWKADGEASLRSVFVTVGIVYVLVSESIVRFIAAQLSNP